MVDASQLREHMEVIGSDGQHVGTVDKAEDNRPKLSMSAQQARQAATGGRAPGMSG